MEEFTQEYCSILESKEWLVRVDNVNSTPYLFKFAVSDEKNTCLLLVTDTKTVWTEALNRKQSVRRWNHCNPSILLENNVDSFSRLQSLIRELHTAGGVSDANFDLVESRDADLGFELDCDKFKWRWDTFLLGPKTSANVISKQLILPLISLTHVAFYLADPVSELEEGDLEKTVDRIGRTARRSIDIHVKQTLARPRIASSLQRISSLLGLAPTLPTIKSDVEPTDLDGRLAALLERVVASDDSPPFLLEPSRSDMHREDVIEATSVHSADLARLSAEARASEQGADAESATESDDDGGPDAPSSTSKERAAQASSIKASARPASVRLLEQPVSSKQSQHHDSDPDPPPAKKIKSKQQDISDSDADSDSGSRGRSQGSQGTTSGTRPVVGRGVRQPLKRGGRRF